MPPRISLSMIVKNEEANLPACLESVADLVDEIVVVDTGSTDRTKEVAARHGARVHDFAWVDDFAAARNKSLGLCTGRWVLWLDADDRLDELYRQRMRAVFAGLQDDLAVYMMRYRCSIGAVDGATSMIDYARVFPNDPRVRWRYRVHEQILPAVVALGGAVRWTDVVVDHTGYADPALTRRKHERNLRLLAMEDRDRPNNPQTLLNIALAYQGLSKPAESMPFLRRCLEILPADSSMRPKVYSLLVQGHQWLGQAEQARTACREGRAHFPEDTELLYREVLMRRSRATWPAPPRCCCTWSRRGRPTGPFTRLSTRPCAAIAAGTTGDSLLPPGPDGGGRDAMAGGADGGVRLYAGLAGAGRTAPAAVALGRSGAGRAEVEEDPRRAVEAAVLKARVHRPRIWRRRHGSWRPCTAASRGRGGRACCWATC